MAKICEHIKANGEQCRTAALWGSKPPRCTVHRLDGGPRRPFEKGNCYGHLITKHGFYRGLFSDFRSLEEKAADLLLKHEQLSACLAHETDGVQVRILFEISLRNLSRLLRLLRLYQQWTGEHPDRLLEMANGEAKARLQTKLEGLRQKLERDVAREGYSTTDKRSPRYWLVYEFIVSCIEQYGVGPTFREIREACHISCNTQCATLL